LVEDNNINDFGYELSIKSVEAFDNGNYLEAIILQVEIFETIIPVLISGRARKLRIDEKIIKSLAYKGNLNTKIDNLIELSGEEFSYLTENLHDYRKRRNRIIHRKTEFKNINELNEFAKDTWLLGTIILSVFVMSIEDYSV